MNTETQPTKRTAQEIFEERRAGLKQYRASPEGRKASAEAERLMDIAKKDDEIIMVLVDKQAEAWKSGDEEMFDIIQVTLERFDKERRNVQQAQFEKRKEANRAEIAEAEKVQIAADAAQRDRDRQRALRKQPFESSELSKLGSSTPRDFARVLELSENYITETANKIGLKKSAGRWVFTKEDAKRLYDRLTGI